MGPDMHMPCMACADGTTLSASLPCARRARRNERHALREALCQVVALLPTPFSATLALGLHMHEGFATRACSCNSAGCAYATAVSPGIGVALQAVHTGRTQRRATSDSSRNDNARAQA